MEGYKKFSPEDFMQDDRFREWVFSKDRDGDSYWLQVLKRFPEKKSDILAARATLNAMKHLQAVPSQEQGDRMWEKIVTRTETEVEWIVERATEHRNYPLLYWVTAACLALLCCSLGWYWFSQKTSEPAITYAAQVRQATVGLIQKVNLSDKTELLQLPDGSTVALASGSRVSYQPVFSGNRREVYLSGEGFFYVVKNNQKPFFVYANRLLTQVVGTSFIVKSNSANDRASVVVKTGKVRVYTLESFQQKSGGKSENMVVLTPNMQVTYDPTRNVLSKSLVATPAIIRQPDDYPDFSFENTSVSKVFETLEKSYGVSITYEGQTIENCGLTAPLGNESLFRKLDIICQTIDATYQVWGTEIVVSGKGCKPE